ncbi:TPA: GNAT family N-acetyltransferase [Burkholderia cenocepacia]|uniref:GNAT family N-acetyltransferase n=1 Tax=Burkholderia cepacia complex TaxID=87882 RepID=UPI001B968C76|nr:GNAT family protein [Burkholderia cenocepacia]MBR8042978.1 GNAT family N-acetyltransferase [Burkholderia cenocepacia]MBR8328408.1 GNAT family N-acetyltransferase [Burkholderia cenocepacia]HDR9801805.1 GNAT family N-acetyltransferase [Burkholderia cenocepacia]HDR9808162.1 GNAT family N-acetyltransferase [Burkholderia cenocepacia]HDR9814998.1 GNAT family N-acetyltransferase [Burkholderia cenocepacia]
MKTVITLRELDRADLPVLNAWRANRTLVDMLGSPFRYVNAEVDDKWFDVYLSNRHRNVRLAICGSETQQMVGVIYLLDIDWISRSAEFAIQIGDSAARGIGIGTEATRLALDHAFDDLNLHRLHLTVLASNAHAIALYEKVGFRAEGLQRQAAFKSGRHVDVVPMALLAHERPARS